MTSHYPVNMVMTDDISTIANAYTAVRTRTEAQWAKSPNAGQEIPRPYHPTRLAYTLGSLFEPPTSLIPLLNQLQDVADREQLVTLVPRPSLHFTFLALTPHAWDSICEMPEVDFVLRAIEHHLHEVPNGGSLFELTSLRLLPTANALLLAGLPSERTLTVRNALIRDLVKDPEVEKNLKIRYGATFPPVFWHTTLVRSQTTFCPQSLRDLYERYHAIDFGTIHLSLPTLNVANFDWSQRQLVIASR